MKIDETTHLFAHTPARPFNTGALLGFDETIFVKYVLEKHEGIYTIWRKARDLNPDAP